jgi:hypothetical protein
MKDRTVNEYNRLRNDGGNEVPVRVKHIEDDEVG